MCMMLRKGVVHVVQLHSVTAGSNCDYSFYHTSSRTQTENWCGIICHRDRAYCAGVVRTLAVVCILGTIDISLFSVSLLSLLRMIGLHLCQHLCQFCVV